MLFFLKGIELAHITYRDACIYAKYMLEPIENMLKFNNLVNFNIFLTVKCGLTGLNFKNINKIYLKLNVKSNFNKI